MGWSIGTDPDRNRDIGYGVPAICDQPGCGKGIDRGVSYRCGDINSGAGCGLFFCDEHLTYVTDDPEGDDPITEQMCDRCIAGEPPHDPTPDTAEWAHHVLTDPSWAQWRRENPAKTTDFKAIVSTTAKDSRMDVPALVAEVERLRAALDAVRILAHEWQSISLADRTDVPWPVAEALIHKAARDLRTILDGAEKPA